MVTPAQLKQRAELYHQLGTSISAGVPLIKALQMASTRQALRASQSTIARLIGYLQEGHSLKDSIHLIQTGRTAPERLPGMEVSLAPHRGKFSIPEFDLELLSVGEETGRLDAVFKQLAEYYAAKAQIIRDTINGLLVTTATLHVFLLVFPLGYLISFVQGIMGGDLSQCRPFIIEKFLVFGALYGAIFLFIFACQGTRGENWRATVEVIFQCVPMLRKALKYLALARFTASLESLTNAGVPVLKSWSLAARSSGSPHLTRQIHAWMPQLETGLTPAEMVNQVRYFPELFANLYSTGEVSGKMDETLVRLRDYYKEEGFRTLRLFTRVLNGTIYFLVVLLVAYNIIQFYKNLYGGMMMNF